MKGRTYNSGDPCKKCQATQKYSNGNCRPCQLVKSKAWREANPEKSKAATKAWVIANPTRFKARLAKWDRENPERRMLTNARQRARDLGLAFDLSQEDLKTPETCPVLGIPLRRGEGQLEEWSPTVDRINPLVGYVRGNVCVISWRANRLKSDATVEELRLVLAYVERATA